MSLAGKKQLDPVNLDSEAQPGTIAYAAENGSRLESLRALRNVITRHLDSENTLARDLASLSRQYMSISKEIDELEALEKQYEEDEVDSVHGSIEDAPFRPETI